MLYSKDAITVCIAIILTSRALRIGALGLAILVIVVIFWTLRIGLTKRTSLPSLEFPVWDPAKSTESLHAIFLVTIRQGEAAMIGIRTT
jgi:hypothetical protein